MIRFFRYLLLVLAGLFGFAGHLSATTVYPLQLNAQIIPPYSNCLGDMVAGNVTSIRVTGLLRDLKAQSYNVGIGMQVYQGSQLKFATKTNHTEVVTNNTIHNFNLKDLFSPNNITGRYDGDGYCLKEGGYEFVFQAFDGGNARLPLSEPVRIHVYLSQAEPPRIIAPANGECVNYNAPVNFVWMEGAVTSYNPNRSYRLEIVELPEHTENLDAKSYINNNSTKITVEGIPGNLNFYTFQNTAGKLVKGRSYLWRVQLYDKTQMVSDARTVYSTSSAVANGGYSEVYSFKYTNCDPFGQRAEDLVDESKKPEIVRVDSSEAFSTVVWKNDPENFPCGYIVCFNRADDTLSNWARVEVGPTDSTYTFKNVENGVQYLTHIIGIVDCQEDGTKTLSANSDNGSFTLPVPEEQECSTTIDGLTSQYSVENLKVNDYFTANDRNIKINKIERFIEGGDTTFSGEGQVLCPWFPTISLTTKFEKVKINRNYELVKGVVYVPTDSSNCGFFDLDEMMNDEYTGDGPAEEMSDKFKEYTSTDEIPEGELGVVNGELYAKVNGQAVDLGKVVPASDYENKIQKGNIDAKSGIVDFEAVSYWNPPYDGDRENYSGDIDKYYTNYSTSSGNYTVPWFAMPDGSTAEIKAKLQVNDNFPLDKLKFVCLTGSQAVELNAQKTQESGDFVYYKLPIFGGEGETSLNLYAVATDKNGNNITLGRAQILSMPKFEQSVVLIPVKREASSIDQASIEKKLNEIYSPLGITYKVTVADKFDGDDLEFMKEGLEVSGTHYMETETDAMKQLKKLYAQNHTIEEDVAYIFVCPKAKYDGAEVKGDMPRSGQTGYVFSTAEKYDDGWTVAHELGHGLYSLQHTFKKESAKGTTNNLMDYNDGSNLKVWQWNLLYSHKDFTTPFLEKDEDGMFSTECAGMITTFLQNATNTLKNSFYGDPAEFKPEAVRTVVETELNKQFIGVEYTKDPIQMILANGAFAFSNTSTAFGCYCEMIGIDNPFALYADLAKAASNCYTLFDEPSRMTNENYCRECIQNIVWPIADEALKKVPGYGQVYDAARTAIDWSNIVSDAVNSVKLTEEQKENGKINIQAYNSYLKNQKEKNMVDMLTSGIVGAFDFIGQNLSSTTWPRIELDLCDFFFDEGYDENLKAYCNGGSLIIESNTAKDRRNYGIEKLVVTSNDGQMEYNTDAIPDRDGIVKSPKSNPLKLVEFVPGVTGWQKVKDAIVNGGTGNKFTRLQGRASSDMFKYTLEQSCNNEFFDYEISYYQFDPDNVSKQELKTMKRTCSCYIPSPGPGPGPDPIPVPTPITKYDDCSGTKFFSGTAYSEQEAQEKANKKRIDFECHNKIPKCAGPWKKVDDYTYTIDAYVGEDGNIVEDIFTIKLSKKNDINSFISCEMDIDKAKQNQWKVIHYEDCITDEIIKENGDVEPIDEFFSKDALYRLIYITRQTLGITNKSSSANKIKSTLHKYLMHENIERNTSVNNGAANAENNIGHFVDMLNENENGSEELIRDAIKQVIASSFIADRKDGWEQAIILTSKIMNSVESSKDSSLTVLEWFLYELLYKGELENKGRTTDSHFRQCFFRSYINPNCVGFTNTTLPIILSEINK